jgi:hypothetical protein
MNKEKNLSYEINYNGILENKVLKELFLDFLNNHTKNESKNLNKSKGILNKWDFINKMHKYKKKKDLEEDEMFDEIMKTYFNENSEKKFYLGEDYLTKLRKTNYVENDEESIQEKFKKILDTLQLEFKLLFQYFLRTNYKTKIFEIYKEDQSILIPKKVIEKEFTDKDFQDYFITDEDFEFIKAINEDSRNWVLLNNFSTTINSYISNTNVN